MPTESDKYVKFNPNRKFTMPSPVSIVNGAPYYNLADMHPTATSGFCILSIGNSGTSMTIKALAYLTGAPVHASHSQYHAHSAFLMRQIGIKVIVVVRDPRDYLLSRMGIRDNDLDLNAVNGIVTGWGEKSAFQSIMEHAAFAPTYAKLSHLQKIKLQLSDAPQPPYGNTFKLYQTLMPFLHRPNTLFIRFEDLINPESREDVLIKMGNFLNLPLNDSIVKYTADHLIGGTVNYNPNEDKIGYWRKHFTPELLQMFESSKLKSVLPQFGYSEDALSRPKLKF